MLGYATVTGQAHHDFVLEANPMKPKTPRSKKPTLTPWARRIAARATWDKLDLPAARLDALRKLTVEARRRPGTPLRVLFTGADAAAKANVASVANVSKASQVLARELQRPLYRVDLNKVVSKYIGETEKNLDRLFADAETADAILLFDEGDALFGKRTAPRDAHDRYANLEAAYWLRRMERYPGMLIVAASGKRNLDEPFIRRFPRVVNVA